MSVVKEEPGIGDISPVAPAGVLTEPMLLLDTTGSMTWSNTGPTDNDPPSRWDVFTEASAKLVEQLEAKDSQAARETAEAGEEAGGLMTITFAKGTDFSVDEDDNPTNGKIGDLNTSNVAAKLGAVQLGGGTEIMPGWNALNEVFLDEFGETPQIDRPKMLAVVVTDGEASDIGAFEAEIAKVGKSAYVVIAIMGYGRGHDDLVGAFQKIASGNDHVRIVSFGNTTSGGTIADAIISLVGQG